MEVRAEVRIVGFSRLRVFGRKFGSASSASLIGDKSVGFCEHCGGW